MTLAEIAVFRRMPQLDCAIRRQIAITSATALQAASQVTPRKARKGRIALSDPGGSALAVRGGRAQVPPGQSTEPADRVEPVLRGVPRLHRRDDQQAVALP